MVKLLWGKMNANVDDDLTRVQWEALKAFRRGPPEISLFNQSVLESLIVLQLVTVSEDRLAMTSRGRQVLLRGSPKLWDVAA